MSRKCQWEPCGAPFVFQGGRNAPRRFCCTAHAQLQAEENVRRRALRWYYDNKPEVMARQRARRALDRATMALKKRSQSPPASRKPKARRSPAPSTDDHS
jgi:predicted deacetylase